MNYTRGKVSIHCNQEQQREGRENMRGNRGRLALAGGKKAFYAIYVILYRYGQRGRGREHWHSPAGEFSMESTRLEQVEEAGGSEEGDGHGEGDTDIGRQVLLVEFDDLTFYVERSNQAGCDGRDSCKI